jgi:ribosomal protein L12E/L44/L45/RPP1/RPP2
MNFIAGILLLVSGDEERTFWIFTALVEDCLQDYFTRTMAGAQVDNEVFGILVKKRLPKLHAHFENVGLPISTVSLRWLMCIFAEAEMPTDTLVRVWDLFFVARSSEPILDIGIGLLRRCEKDLLRLDDMFELKTRLCDSVTETVDFDALNKFARDCRSKSKINVDALRVAEYERLTTRIGTGESRSPVEHGDRYLRTLGLNISSYDHNDYARLFCQHSSGEDQGDAQLGADSDDDSEMLLSCQGRVLTEDHFVELFVDLIEGNLLSLAAASGGGSSAATATSASSLAAAAAGGGNKQKKKKKKSSSSLSSSSLSSSQKDEPFGARHGPIDDEKRDTMRALFNSIDLDADGAITFEQMMAGLTLFAFHGIDGDSHLRLFWHIFAASSATTSSNVLSISRLDFCDLLGILLTMYYGDDGYEAEIYEMYSSFAELSFEKFVEEIHKHDALVKAFNRPQIEN